MIGESVYHKVMLVSKTMLHACSAARARHVRALLMGMTCSSSADAGKGGQEIRLAEAMWDEGQEFRAHLLASFSRLVINRMRKFLRHNAHRTNYCHYVSKISSRPL